MNIALIGAGGNIGRRIATEALSRHHAVTGIQRKPDRITDTQVKAVAGDLAEPAALAQTLKGFDVVVSAISPEDAASFLANYRNLFRAVREAGVPRLVIIGGAGNLLVAPGLDVLGSGALDDAPYKWVAEAHRDLRRQLDTETGVDWTYFSPAGLIQPGERTGSFRLGTTNLVVDDKGQSTISYEDYALALVDELENPRHNGGKQFTIGY